MTNDKSNTKRVETTKNKTQIDIYKASQSDEAQAWQQYANFTV